MMYWHFYDNLSLYKMTRAMEPCIFATGVVKIKLCRNDRLGFMHEPLKHNFFELTNGTL